MLFSKGSIPYLHKPDETLLKTLSKGTKEKVQLVLVMSRRAKLYLLDEPENSLSAELQLDLLKFIENSARFYNCQFIISTHSQVKDR